MTNIQKEQIRKLRKEGQSYSKVASILGVPENTIKSYCRRNNLGSNKVNKPNVKQEICISCKQCGKPIVKGSKGKPKKFCSDNCRRMWWKANNNQLVKKAYYSITCVECGKKFESYGNKNRKFCSHGCYINNRFKKERNINESRAI